MIKRISIVLLVLLASLAPAHSEWSAYGRYKGTIPGTVFPVQLQAGDTLRLSAWYHDSALDYYVYSEGQDILGETTYVWKHTDSTTYGFNNVSGTGAGKYFVRYDWKSGAQSFIHKLEINGIVQLYSADSLSASDDGFSLVPLSVSSGCSLRITYTDSSGYPISVQSQSGDMANIANGVASSTGSETTKTIEVQNLDPSLTWFLVVHHGLLSAFDVENFKVVLETDSSSPCTNHCSDNMDIYSLSFPELGNSCGCLEGSVTVFDSNYNLFCDIKCYSVDYSTGRSDGGSGCICLEGGASDEFMECPEPTTVCQNGSLWNQTQNKCVNECNTTFATGRLIGKDNVCECQNGSSWNETEGMCVIDCNMTFALGRVDGVQDLCECQTGFSWNDSELNCVHNCRLKYAVGRVQGEQNVCECQEGYSWSLEDEICLIDCVMAHATRLAIGEIDICSCQYNFNWDKSILSCVVDCKSPHAIGQVSGSIEMCVCQEKFIWSMESFICEAVCEQIPYTIGKNPMEKGSCLCQDYFSWEESEVACLINCTLVQMAGEERVGQAECECPEEYLWDGQGFACVKDDGQFPGRGFIIAISIGGGAGIIFWSPRCSNSWQSYEQKCCLQTELAHSAHDSS